MFAFVKHLPRSCKRIAQPKLFLSYKNHKDNAAADQCLNRRRGRKPLYGSSKKQQGNLPDAYNRCADGRSHHIHFRLQLWQKPLIQKLIRIADQYQRLQTSNHQKDLIARFYDADKEQYTGKTNQGSYQSHHQRCSHCFSFFRGLSDQFAHNNAV